jgi:hypothetical protein
LNLLQEKSSATPPRTKPRKINRLVEIVSISNTSNSPISFKAPQVLTVLSQPTIDSSIAGTRVVMLIVKCRDPNDVDCDTFFESKLVVQILNLTAKLFSMESAEDQSWLSALLISPMIGLKGRIVSLLF